MYSNIFKYFLHNNIFSDTQVAYCDLQIYSRYKLSDIFYRVFSVHSCEREKGDVAI